MVWLHEADVVIQTNCIRTGRTVRTQTVKRTSLGYCLDDANRALLVVGRSEKEQLEWPVAGGVQILARFAEQGKATLTIPKQHKVLLVSRADPHELIRCTMEHSSSQPLRPSSTPLALLTHTHPSPLQLAARASRGRAVGQGDARTRADQRIGGSGGGKWPTIQAHARKRQRPSVADPRFALRRPAAQEPQPGTIARSRGPLARSLPGQCTTPD